MEDNKNNSIVNVVKAESPAVKFLDSLDTKKLIKSLVILVMIAIFAVILIFTIYFVQFSGDISSNQNVWGVFGDFIGGTLNPILSFFMLIAIVLTLVVQNKEMQLTREELEKSAEALEHQREISAKQSVHFDIQAKKEDVYRMIKEVYKDIITESELVKKFYENNSLVNGKTYKIFEVFGKNNDIEAYDNIDSVNEKNGSINAGNLEHLIQLMEELKFYLNEYNLLSKKNTVVYYYAVRIYNYALNLREKAYISSDIYEFYEKNYNLNLFNDKT